MAEENLLLAFINHHRNGTSEVFKLRVAPPRARVEGGEEVTAKSLACTLKTHG